MVLKKVKPVVTLIGDNLNSSAAILYDVEILRFFKSLIFSSSVLVESEGLTFASNEF